MQKYGARKFSAQGGWHPNADEDRMDLKAIARGREKQLLRDELDELLPVPCPTCGTDMDCDATAWWLLFCPKCGFEDPDGEAADGTRTR